MPCEVTIRVETMADLSSGEMQVLIDIRGFYSLFGFHY